MKLELIFNELILSSYVVTTPVLYDSNFNVDFTQSMHSFVISFSF
jgi:hypothetical protein